MKDRVREAVFNLLGPSVRGKHALDLFAGTGALGLEAISRGAARATLIEQHHPTAQTLRENIAVLGVESVAEVITANVFLRSRWQDRLGQTPWLVFCSPPYAFYVERAEPMLDLLGGLIAASPALSEFVVEADEGFDFQQLPDPDAWDVRTYPPAVIGIYVKPPPP
jgi:16S rRNA (guanine966-N2)-methyltransferase